MLSQTVSWVEKFKTESSLFTVAAVVITVTLLNLLLCWTRSRGNKEQKLSESVQRKQQKLRAATYPKQFANGWYRVANSDEVSKGQTKRAFYFHQELAIFRGEDGKVAVLDAHCPHLGAHLAVGGKVVGNDIQCPFHKWRFDRSGKCSMVPYCAASYGIPAAASVFSWPVVEKYGMIMVWYHAEREEPHYQPIDIPELNDEKAFRFITTFSYPGIKMHQQEFAENSADQQHFQALHGDFLIPFTNISIPTFGVLHSATFELGEESHTCYFNDRACLTFLGKEVPRTSVKAKILFYGPGSVCLFSFDTPFGKIHLFHTHSPTDYMELDVMFVCYAERKIPKFLIWYVVGSWISQWKNDVDVWENKIFKRVPTLAKGDGPILKLRRWYKQFYAKSIEW